MSEMTTEILQESLGKIVLVRLKSGKSLRGRLKGFDQHLNLVLEETEDTTEPENTKKLGILIVRGDNVIIISPPPRCKTWEKALLPSANTQLNFCTSSAGDAEEGPTA